MSWRDIVAKAGKKPDYLDFDKDGDKEESMTEALESAKKGFSYEEKNKRESPASKDKKRRKAELRRMQERLESAKKSAYKSKRCEQCNAKIQGTRTRCKKCENEDVEKKISLRGNRCSNPDCMAKVENAGDMCDKCKNKSRGRGFTR